MKNQIKNIITALVFAICLPCQYAISGGGCSKGVEPAVVKPAAQIELSAQQKARQQMSFQENLHRAMQEMIKEREQAIQDKKRTAAQNIADQQENILMLKRATTMNQTDINESYADAKSISSAISRHTC